MLGGSLAALSAGIIHAVSLRSAADVVVALLFLMNATIGAFMLLMAVTGFVDLVRGARLLVLGPHSFMDRRQCREAIAWSNVSYAKVTYTRWGFAGVYLKLRHPVKACHNPFRIGTMFALWRRRADELHVSIIFLNWSGHDIAHTILALVKRHGGATDLGSPDPWRDWLNARAFGSTTAKHALKRRLSLLRLWQRAFRATMRWAVQTAPAQYIRPADNHSPRPPASLRSAHPAPIRQRFAA